MGGEARLRVFGLVEGGPVEHDRAGCARLAERHQVADVGALVAGKRGRAVTLKGLLEETPPLAGARWLNVLSSDRGFAVSVPLEEVGEALVVYELDGAPLPPKDGGPFRLVVPGHADACVHVKALGSLELAAGPGRDTRPQDDAEHAKLHARGA
jgi:2-dehydropantoate 2-reductase